MGNTQALPPTIPPNPVAERSSLLRLWLAVRDWADPRSLMADLEDDTRRQVLNAVARDVDIDPRNRPGLWSLKNEVRRRVTASRPYEALIKSAQAAGGDPVAAAIRLVLDPAKSIGRLADHDGGALETLQTVLSWLPETIASPGIGNVAGLRREVAGILAARRREADVSRLSKQVVGQETLVQAIKDFLLGASTYKPDYTPTDPPVAFAWGLGGSGKSTLVAEVETVARAGTPPAVIVHLDFDRATLNPAVDGALDLAFLAQVGAADSDMGAAARSARHELELTLARQHKDEFAAAASISSVSRTRRAARAGTRLVKSARSSLESIEAERKSLVAGTMVPFAASGRPLLLILDSIEAVEVMGLAAMRSLERWAATTGALAGQPDTRILAAGRRQRISHETGIAWFERWKGEVRDFEIDQLGDADRKQLLADRGMDDARTRHLAAEAIPGNPLILRFTAEAWSKEETAREGIRADIAQGKVPEAAARRYLEERLVRHMQDPAARPYVVPALAIPRLTRPVIGAVLLPAVKPPATRKMSAARRTQQIYDAFRAATWLTSERANGRELVLRPEVRSFALQLARQVPETAETLRQVHEAAAAWHQSRKGSEDRAFAFYHRAMLGPVEIPPERSCRSFTRILGDAVTDLPEPVRDALTNKPARPDAALDAIVKPEPQPYPTLDEDEWEIFFEGKGERDGLAWQLVEADNGLEALSLYRSRPTREGILPPTPILRALVETGEPVEGVATLMEAEFTMPARDGAKTDLAWVERLYWLVRAMCMADPEAPPTTVPFLVRDALLRGLSAASASGDDYRTRHKDLIDIAAIYFLSQAKAASLIDAMTERLGLSNLPHRIALARLLRSLPVDDVSTTAEHILVRQLGIWLMGDAAWKTIIGDSVTYPTYREQLVELSTLRLTAIESTLSIFENGPIRLRTSDLAREDAVQLLRGLTPEIHRPLRHALVEAWKPFTSHMATTSPREVVRTVVRETLQSMSVRPAEFEEPGFWNLVESDPAVWFGAFVTFADRARVLRQMTDIILREAEDAPEPPLHKLVDIARIFRRWDNALTDGAGSRYIS